MNLRVLCSSFWVGKKAGSRRREEEVQRERKRERVRERERKRERERGRAVERAKKMFSFGWAKRSRRVVLVRSKADRRTTAPFVRREVTPPLPPPLPPHDHSTRLYVRGREAAAVVVARPVAAAAAAGKRGSVGGG
jgi:hypothetical protein